MVYGKLTLLMDYDIPGVYYIAIVNMYFLSQVLSTSWDG